MAGRWRLLVGLALVGLVVAGPAGAVSPMWSSPQTITDSGFMSGVGIDRRGNVSATWFDGDARRLLGAVRPAGGTSFGPAIELAAAYGSSDLEVNGDGQVLLVWEDDGGCRGLVCPATLRFRAGEGLERLGPATTLTERSFRAASALGEGGHAAIVWQTGPRFSGGLNVVVREPGGRLGGVQRLAPPDPDGEEGVPFASVAVDRTGDVVVAWQQAVPQRSNGGFDIYASFRRAGGRFGAPERLWNFRREKTSSASPLAAIDARGEATVLFAADGMRAATRPRGGSFAAPRRVGPPGAPLALVSNAAGKEFAAWGGDGPDSPIYLATRSQGGRFSSPMRLALPGQAGLRVGLDSRGNVLAALLGGPAERQRLRAATFTRIGFFPLELTDPLTENPADASTVAVNERGAAAVIFNEYPQGYSGGPGVPLRFITRPADRTPPDLGALIEDAPRGSVEIDLGCDEPCRVRGWFGLRKTGRRSARLAGARNRRTTTLAKPGHGRLVLRLTRAERKQVRRRLRRSRRARVWVRVRAVDSSGNRVTATRRLPAKRILR